MTGEPTEKCMEDNGKVTVAVLGERIRYHHLQLMDITKSNERQHEAIRQGLDNLGTKVSGGLSAAHRRIDRIMVGAIAGLVGISGIMLSMIVYLLIEGPPWGGPMP